VTAPTLKKRVEAAQALAAKATPGPWKQDDDCHVFSVPLSKELFSMQTEILENKRLPLTEKKKEVYRSDICDGDQQHPEAAENMDLISAAPDHVALLGELWKALQTAEKDAERYRHLRDHYSYRYLMQIDSFAELGISFEWQQTKPGEESNGLEYVLDCEIEWQKAREAEDAAEEAIDAARAKP